MILNILSKYTFFLHFKYTTNNNDTSLAHLIKIFQYISLDIYKASKYRGEVVDTK